LCLVGAEAQSINGLYFSSNVTLTNTFQINVVVITSTPPGHDQQSYQVPSTQFDVIVIATIVSGVLLITLLFILAVSILVFILRRRHRLLKSNTTFYTNGSSSMMKSTKSPVECNIDGVIVLDRLVGYFGDFHKGTWKGEDVALKKIKEGNQEDIMKELQVLQKLNHPNIIQYLGIHNTPDNEIFIIMEYMPLGSLNHLLQNEQFSITVDDLIGLSKQLIEGMFYLKESSIIHKNLGLRNVLVCDPTEEYYKYTVKISDLGFYNDILDDEMDDRIKWCAPEVIETGVHSMESTVWSFGLLLWEIFSYGQLPYEYDNNKAKELILQGEVMPQTTKCPDEMYDIMKRCWYKSPNERLSFREILDEIESLWQQVKAQNQHKR